MKNKRTHSLSLYCTVFFCLVLKPLLLAFQVADGSPALQAAGARYIFYWGKFQCELSPATKHAGTINCTAAAFRQMLHGTPYLWTGAGMAERISFKLEGIPTTATRDGRDYPALIGQLDEAIGKKVNAGQVILLTDLQLDAQTRGRVEFYIEAATAAAPDPAYRAAANTLNTLFLDKVIWGREDIYENANRDFFSETEFWQTVKQQPVIEWAPYAQPQAVRAGIRFHDIGETPLDLRVALESPAYGQMLENLEHYRHLLKPGSAVTLTLHSAEQHERLYEKTMNIVADDDPRLALRRNRDTHTLKIKWGGWVEKMDNLYLLELKDARGNTITVDPPASLRVMIRQREHHAMLAERPEFWIDGQPVPDMTFRLSTAAQSVVVQPGQPLPDLGLERQDSSAMVNTVQITLDSLRAPGYVLPALHFSLNFFSLRENLRVRNQLHALQAAPGTALVKIHPLVRADAGYAVDLEILEETAATMSIFTPEGENVFSLENKYPPGRHTVEIPRIAFRRPGLYYLFLNTAFGVARQELVLE